MKTSDHPWQDTEVTGGSLAAGDSALCRLRGTGLFMFGDGPHCHVLAALRSHISFKFWAPTYRVSRSSSAFLYVLTETVGVGEGPLLCGGLRRMEVFAGAG